MSKEKETYQQRQKRKSDLGKGRSGGMETMLLFVFFISFCKSSAKELVIYVKREFRMKEGRF